MPVPATVTNVAPKTPTPCPSLGRAGGVDGYNFSTAEGVYPPTIGLIKIPLPPVSAEAVRSPTAAKTADFQDTSVPAFTALYPATIHVVQHDERHLHMS